MTRLQLRKLIREEIKNIKINEFDKKEQDEHDEIMANAKQNANKEDLKAYYKKGEEIKNSYKDSKGRFIRNQYENKNDR